MLVIPDPDPESSICSFHKSDVFHHPFVTHYRNVTHLRHGVIRRKAETRVRRGAYKGGVSHHRVTEFTEKI